jgi:hypothetical protein
VRKSGNKVRITASSCARRQHAPVVETYERTLDDVFAIQDEIAAAVVAQLKIAAGGRAAARPIDARLPNDPAGKGVGQPARRKPMRERSSCTSRPGDRTGRAERGRPGWMYSDQGSFLQRPAVEAPPGDGRLEKALALDPDDAVTHACSALLTDDDLAVRHRTTSGTRADPDNVEVSTTWASTSTPLVVWMSPWRCTSMSSRDPPARPRTTPRHPLLLRGR